MMTIVKGNLLTAKEKFIGHQCNCTSKKAAGLAYSIFNLFPYSDIYSSRTKPDLPGHIIIRGDNIKNRLIINMVAQYYPGKPKPTSILDSATTREGYFWQCLLQISKIEQLNSVAFPFGIGTGMAMGNREHYLDMLHSFSILVNETTETKVVLYDNS